MRLSFDDARNLNIDEDIIRRAEQAGVATKFLDAELKAELSKPKQTKSEDGYDSKLERDFSGVLKRAEREQWIKQWWHHPCGFRLAPKCYFHPDFLVEPVSRDFYPYTDGTLTLVEVKGGWFRDDAKVKTKVVAPMYPCFRWLLVTREKRNGWDVREVSHAGIGTVPIHVPWIS